MVNESRLSRIFIGLFVFFMIMGPGTQMLQIINLPLHVELGLSENIILQPEFGWFRADELAIAWADMSYLLSGIIFLVGVYLRKPWCIPFGFYTSAAWSFILLMARIRWHLLEANGFGVLAEDQQTAYYIFAYAFVLFGWYGMYYLWHNRTVYDGN